MKPPPLLPATPGITATTYLGSRYTADGLDEYDFGARRHYPRFPAFTTPDPHADNTPWLSPYVFCAANPVAYVDPSGMDQFKYNEDGHLIEQIEDNERDVVSVVSTSGTEIDSVELSYGTVSVDTQQKDKNGNSTMVMEVNGYNAAKQIFELFGDLCNVEFSFESIRQESKNIQNIISTSHSSNRETSIVQYNHDNIDFSNATILSHIHNHPSETNIPSPQDVSFAMNLNRMNHHKVDYSIYLKNKAYVNYSGSWFWIGVFWATRAQSNY